MSLFKRFLFRVFRKNETEIHELNYLFWECTWRCNLSCRHRGSDCKAESNVSDMPFADFLRALEPLEHRYHTKAQEKQNGMFSHNVQLVFNGKNTQFCNLFCIFAS